MNKRINNQSKTYSENINKILEISDRLKKGKRIIKILKDSVNNLKNKSCLDIGCSSGVITNLFTKEFKSVVGIDNDDYAIKLAKKEYKSKKLSFKVMKGEKLLFKNQTFDVVICAQVYNSVDDVYKMMSEINRVLKPGGICFFSGRNKYAFVERQYDLPFLSWLPKNIGDKYINFAGKGESFIGHRYLNYWQIKALFKDFSVDDYTIKILNKPQKFGFTELISINWIKKLIPFKVLMPIIPNYIFILRK